MNKHIAEFRGETFTRNSKTRTYSHLVVCRWSYEADYKRADCEWPNDRSNYRYYVEHGDVRVAGLTEDEFVNQEIYKRVSKVDADEAMGCYETLRDGGWSSRLDLAEKNAAKFRNNPMYCDVHIVEARLLD